MESQQALPSVTVAHLCGMKHLEAEPEAGQGGQISPALLSVLYVDLSHLLCSGEAQGSVCESESQQRAETLGKGRLSKIWLLRSLSNGVC